MKLKILMVLQVMEIDEDTFQSSQLTSSAFWTLNRGLQLQL